jgi:Secretion system C-terminal sorting domain
MKKNYLLRSYMTVYFLFVSLLTTQLAAQVHSPRTITINSNCNGFYEYLPQGYETGSDTYPLMVFLHGISELGNGSTDLYKILFNGPPRLINDGIFPVSFSIGGGTHKFIVISPQFIIPPSEADVAAVVNYAKQNYRVNINRVYLTGLSMGGGAVSYYASLNSITANGLAAVLTACGSAPFDASRGATIANASLPYWGTHNTGDGTVLPSVTINNINNINNTVPAPLPSAKLSLFTVNSHDAWTQTYDPNFRENGLNVYEWMLTYQRNLVALPIVLSEFSGSQTAEKTTTLKWKTLSEEHAANFILERSTDAVQFNLVATVAAANTAGGRDYSYIDTDVPEGINFYRLSETDKTGKKTIYKTISLVLSYTKKTGVQAFPNPVDKQLQLQLSSAVSGTLRVSLSDMRGATIKTWTFNSPSASWKQSLDLSFLAAGNYALRVTGSKTDEIIRIIKK